jgi:hypothetical protein
MLSQSQIIKILEQENELAMTELSSITDEDFYTQIKDLQTQYEKDYLSEKPFVPKRIIWLAIHNIKQLKELREHKIYLLAREAQKTDIINTNNLLPEELEHYETLKKAIKEFHTPNTIKQLKDLLYNPKYDKEPYEPKEEE